MRARSLLTLLPLALAAALAAPSTEAPTSADGPRFWTSRPNPRALPLPAEEDAFTFAVFGDRTGGPAEGVAVLAQAVDEVNLVGPDLVMTVGDLIQGYNQTDEWLEEMREYRAIMERLGCEWFPVAGNHDVYWRGEGRPPEEHEGRFEVHFGPLWYAFRHKSSCFIVLYTDEPNPDTGERNFGKPECQRMSPAQLAWLRGTLRRASDADHVFVFCHHPRWIGGNYGDDWERVHELLVEAGNVSAVFGGHIHRMRYDPRDGIEYFALATVGGHQNGTVPEAGYLHHYDLVTVRADGIDRATIPVGATMDPRAITGEVSSDAPRLTGVVPFLHERPAMAPDGAVAGQYRFRLENPTTRPADLAALLTSPDGRWSFEPDHVHGVLAAGEQRTFTVRAARTGGGSAPNLDDAFAPAELEVRFDYLADAARFTVPARTHVLDLDLTALPAPPRPATERALALSGGAHVAVPAAGVELPDGPFTLECWIAADAFGGRQGVVAKTENSEYGFFASDGRPSFSVHLDGRYVEARADGAPLGTGDWHHLAGVFDGAEVRLYVDGTLAARAPGTGRRTTNKLPLIVGGDVNGGGGATSTLEGRIDEVRLSRVVRYSGERFTPSRRHESDAETVLLLAMDGGLGPWLFDTSPAARRLTVHGPGRVVEAAAVAVGGG